MECDRCFHVLGKEPDISTNLFVRIWETISAGIGGQPGPRINASDRPPWIVGVPIVGTPVAIDPICRALARYRLSLEPS